MPDGDDRPAQRLVDGDVDDVVQRIAPHRPQVLAHAVEDDDRVVGREAGDRQERRDDVQRQVVAEEGQERERHEQVVNRRDDRADGEAELKAERDVGQDADERQDGGPDALARQLLADRRTDDLGADDVELAEIGLLERRLDLIGLVASARLPDSAPTCGTRISIWRCAASP